MSSPSSGFPGSKETTVSLNIRLFGSFSVQVGDAPLPPLRTRKGAWLLALLVLRHPKPVDRSWLAATLWPDSEHEVALKNLRTSLHDLRKALGEQGSRLHAPKPSTLALDLSAAEVDLFVFDALLGRSDAVALEQAIGLYAGCLLEGCQEEWVLAERDRREQQCLEALETLAVIESREGLFAQAVQRLRICVGIDPLRETAQRALITALAAAGDFAGATQVYREFRLRLHEKLQSSPTAETTALYEQIRVRARQAASQPRMSPGAVSPTAGSLPDEVPPRSLTNLPESVTSFIGREEEIEQVRALLNAGRLLTLTGSGGSGKTRLALQIARKLLETFPDGVWLVELASLSDPDLVPQAVASVFSLRERPGTSLVHTITETLAAQRLLLVLDNCEHLLAACSQLVSALLRSCPGVCLLAASRERIGISGEQIYRVPSLALPNPTIQPTVENVGNVEAVRLFVERAHLHRPTFVLNTHNVLSVTSLCRRLDGIPLALELAAARVRSLSVEDIETRLERRFDLLTGGDRSAVPRHQTLRALIDWSYDLLNEQEKLLLQRLSIFPGGWTLEAAERVAAGSPLEGWAVLDLLTSLVDKSLVLAEERDGSVRYRMFETLRHYASEKLEASGETEQVFARRRAWILALEQEADAALRSGRDHEVWLNRLETEHDNLRATLSRPGTDAEAVQEGLQLAALLWQFWSLHCHISEGREHLRRALEREGAQERTRWRARALNIAGNLADNQGDYAAAMALFLESVNIRKEIGARTGELMDTEAVVHSYHGLGHLAVRQDDPVTARAMYEEARDAAAELVQRRREVGNRSELSFALLVSGHVASDMADYATALRFYEECLFLCRELGNRHGVGEVFSYMGLLAGRTGDYSAAHTFYLESLASRLELGNQRGIALCYDELGGIAYKRGDYAAARNYYEQALPVFNKIGDRQYVAHCLEGLASVMLALGEPVRAGRLWGTAAAIRIAIGAPWRIDERVEIEPQMNRARSALGEGAFEAAFAEGQSLAWEQVALTGEPS